MQSKFGVTERQKSLNGNHRLRVRTTVVFRLSLVVGLVLVLSLDQLLEVVGEVVEAADLVGRDRDV